MQRNRRKALARTRRAEGSGGKEAGVVDIEAARSIEVRGHRIGWLVGWLDDEPQVDFTGNPHQRLVARSTVPLDELREARPRARARPQVLLVFDGQRSDCPIIVGLMADGADRTTDRGMLAPNVLCRQAETGSTDDEEELRLIGRRIVLEGADEVVLQSGKASVTLRKNGRLVQRGTYVESYSKGVNRIKGGSVKIN